MMWARNLWVLYGVLVTIVLAAWLVRRDPSDARPQETFDLAELDALPGTTRDGDALPAPGVIPSPGSAGTGQLPAGIEPFAPPGDGKLTDDHLNMFTRVARAARRTVSGRIDDLTLQWAEARAAESLGFDPKGYRWVQARIHLALVQNERRAQAEATVAMRENLIAQVEQMRADATSENERAIIETELEDMLGSLPGTLPAESEAERHNRLLVRANLGPLREAMGLGSERLGPKLEVIEEPAPGDETVTEDAPPTVEEEELLVPYDGPVGPEVIEEAAATAAERGTDAETDTVLEGEDPPNEADETVPADDAEAQEGEWLPEENESEQVPAPERESP